MEVMDDAQHFGFIPV